MPLCEDVLESLKHVLSRRKVQRCRRPTCHFLDVLVDKEELPIGSIITSLDNVKRLNSERLADAFHDRRTVRRRGNLFYGRYRAGFWSSDMYSVETATCDLDYVAGVGRAQCRQAVAASARVQAWFRDTGYQRPAYLVTARKSAVGAATRTTAKGRGSRTGFDQVGFADKTFAVRLVELSYQKPLLGGPPELVGREYSRHSRPLRCKVRTVRWDI